MTIEQLKRISKASTARLEKVYPLLIKYMTMYDITTNARIAAFLAQIIHESGNFYYTKEIASGKAYEGRKDLGNVNAGDGVKYKGRGFIQITGRANYAQLSKATQIDFLNSPELLESAENAVMSACWWWNMKGLNKMADNYEFIRITKVINGGTNGLVQRKAIYLTAQKVLG
jgi:putative chitinase